MIKVIISTQPFVEIFIYNIKRESIKNLQLKTKAMIAPNEMNDNELMEKIENCSLSPTFFTHEVLLRMTYILIKKYGIEEAVSKNCEIKEQYFLKALNSNKFNYTLTRAYTEILHHFMSYTKNTSFDKLLRDYPRLRYNFKDLVRTHYGYDILKEHRKEDSLPPRPILFTF